MSKWFSSPPPCEYGSLIRIPFSSFTAPSYASVADILAMIYSCVPMAIVASIVCFACFTRKFLASLVFLLLFLVHFPVTEILKISIRQSRPLGSCNGNFGMPSGHSFACLSFLSFFFCFLFLRQIFSPAHFSHLTPSHSGPQPTLKKKTQIFFLLCLLLLPVPWARVQLRDHSPAQVSAGAALGVCWGVLWAFLQPRVVARIRQLLARTKKQPNSPVDPVSLGRT